MSEETRRFLERAGGTGAAAAASRTLGMLRDALLASLLGVGDVMDALVTALRLPDLSRRLMQEGALTAEFVPEAARRASREAGAGGFVVAALRLWLVLSILFLIAGEGATLALFSWESVGTRDELTRRLFAIALPFVPLVAGASLLAGTLQALGRFRAPAFASALLNVLWLAALAGCFAMPDLDRVTAATILAASLSLGGAVQFVMLFVATRAAGVQPQRPTDDERRLARRIAWRAPVVAAAILVAPLCMSLDGAWAWAASRSEGFPAYAWIPGSEQWSRRLDEGAASAAYCSERVCMLPVGIAASAIGAVALPAIAAAAARAAQQSVRREWTRALRWATFLAVPAGAGVWFVGEPLAQILFGHGEAGPDAADRIARWISVYALAIPPAAWGGILVRGLSATGALRFAAIWGVVCVWASFVLDAIAALAGRELALAWTTAGMLYVHAAGLAYFAAIRRRGLEPGWIATLMKSAAATAVMLLCLEGVRSTLLSRALEAGFVLDVLFLVAATLTGGVVYFAAAYALRMTEGEELLAAKKVRES